MRDDKPFRLSVRVKNNRLIRAREEMGYSQAEAARRIGVNASSLSAYEALRFREPGAAPDDGGVCPPWGRHGWTLIAKRIAKFYGLAPEYLFPDCLRQVRKPGFDITLSANEALAMAKPPTPYELLEERDTKARVAELLKRARLDRQEREIIEHRFLGDGSPTLLEVGERMQNKSTNEIGMSRERVRQLEERALDKLRKAVAHEGEKR